MKDMLYSYCGCHEEMFGKEGPTFLDLMLSSIVVSWESSDILFLYERTVIPFL